jgi:long-subunit acyl-CoA synthetase (AMP-forming)
MSSTIQAKHIAKVTITENPAIENAKSILEIFYQREKMHPDKVYLRQPSGDDWHEFTWSDVGQQARKVVSALRDIGLEKGDHVGIISKNCAHWIIADLAILMGGFVSVPFYSTLSSAELKHVIGLSDIKTLFVGKLDDWESQRKEVPDSVTCIALPHHEGNSLIDSKLQWATILKHYAPAKKLYKPNRKDIFTIMYTSGTTGTPKGVIISYECINQLMGHERQQPAFGIYQGVSERVISYLPLNHIAERIVSEVNSIVAGSEISFIESLDTFSDNLQSVQPTQFFAVPRVWLKVQQSILSKIPQKKLNILLKLPLIKSVVKYRILAGLGMAELKSAISGAAPISADLLEWYAKLDIDIQEVYGSTELCGGVSFNTIGDINAGTVGKPVFGAKIKIDIDSDEILVKTPWSMIGYYKSPQKTTEVFENEYYKTGDTGRFDSQGHLIITGRIVDDFKTSQGCYVRPLPIEQLFHANPNIELVMITGPGLKQPIALICLNSNPFQNNQTVSESLLDTLHQVNSNLSNEKKVSHLVIFEDKWQDNSQFLTPTLNIKRYIVDAEYKKHYKKWQKSPDTIVWL